MSEHEDGGAAFPVTNLRIEDQCYASPGMSLRDFFAAHAMIGILSARNGFLVDVGIDSTAPWAYQIADAMLVEREKVEDDT